MMFKFNTITASALLAISFVNVAFASVGVHCGTTNDATLSDCRALVDPGTWSGAWAGKNNVCHFGAGHVAYNTACHGNCCVYAATHLDTFDPNSETIRQEAVGLLGCGNTGNNKVNGLETFSDGHGVCLSNGSGCGDCFDDSDFFWP